MLLADLLEHARRVVDIVGDRDADEVENDEIRRSAILWNTVVLGEIANRTPLEVREAHSEIPWQASINQRNVIAHGYDIIEWSRIHELVTEHIPSLIVAAARILDTYGPPPES